MICRSDEDDENPDRTAVSAADVEYDSGDAPFRAEAAAGSDSRISICVTSYRRYRHDTEGVSIKAVLDGLVRRGIIADDSAEKVREVCFRSIICGKEEQERTLIDIFIPTRGRGVDE